MRKEVLVFLLCSVVACSQQVPDKDIHTVDGAVPLYVDGAQSGIDAPTLSPELISQAKTSTNLGDVLHLLGPAYVARNDPAHIARWHFSDGTMLTLWPQGGEKLSDHIAVYPNPNCGTTDCKDLVLGRMEAERTDKQQGGLVYGPSTQQSATTTVEQGAANVFLNTIARFR